MDRIKDSVGGDQDDDDDDDVDDDVDDDDDDDVDKNSLKFCKSCLMLA